MEAFQPVYEQGCLTFNFSVVDTMKCDTHTLLLVDDNAHDSLLLHEALLEIDPLVKSINAYDGYDALQKLEQAELHGKLPTLIILDINMPRMNGVEALSAIRSHDVYNNIPLVILTTSSYEPERNFFAERGVKMFTKPNSHNELLHIAGEILEYSKLDA